MTSVTISGSISTVSGTRTCHDENGNNKALWKINDMIGVAASYGVSSSKMTDSHLQHFTVTAKADAGNALSTASFKGSLTDFGRQSYTFYCVYPYPAFGTTSSISRFSGILPEWQVPLNGSWDGTCDMMVSQPVTRDLASVGAEALSVKFCRLFGFLKLDFGESVTSLYGNEEVETITITDKGFGKMAGSFSFDMTSQDNPNLAFSTVSGQTSPEVTLDYKGQGIKLKDLAAWFVINPGTYADVQIRVNTTSHSLDFQRSGLVVARGGVTNATVTWKDGDSASERSPLFKRNPDQLKVLIFGHSYVMDSMEYLDDLLRDAFKSDPATLKKITFANFMVSSQSLSGYWSQYKNGETIKYYKSVGGATPVLTNKTIVQGVEDDNWDYVIFQTETSEGIYSDYNPYFTDLRNEVLSIIEAKYKKTPVIGWHMFWSYGSARMPLDKRFANYNNDPLFQYQAHVDAARKLMGNDGVELIIPTGTTIQSLRATSLNNPYKAGMAAKGAYEFTRDGCHVDYGAGRYAVACTWFETFIEPCFGVSVYGNTFMPTNYSAIKVTEKNRPVLQQAAVLAVRNKFEISPLEVPQPDPEPEPESDELEASGDIVITNPQVVLQW